MSPTNVGKMGALVPWIFEVHFYTNKGGGDMLFAVIYVDVTDFFVHHVENKMLEFQIKVNIQINPYLTVYVTG